MDNNKNNDLWWRPGLIIFTKVSASIAVPIVFALFIGKYLDKKYNSDPWIFLGLTFIAFLFSLFYIWKNVVSYMNNLEKSASTQGGEEKDLPTSGKEKK